MTLSDAELDALVSIARRAGERVASLYQEHVNVGIDVGQKGPGDPVTAADREADALIHELLAARFPDAAVVSEEEGCDAATTMARVLAHERTFWVDPVDGTAEFVARRGEFAVMIGLAVEGRAVAGVIVIPAEGLTLAGAEGKGAWVEKDGADRHVLSVSSCDTFARARMVVSRSHRPPLIEPLRRRLGITEVEPCGSVGVKVARIALGRAELYAHDGPGCKRWDCCAPDAILHAAGGRMTDLDGGVIDYAAVGTPVLGLLATNGVLHAGALSAVDWARREARRVEP